MKSDKKVIKHINVDLMTQVLTAYENGKEVFRFDCVSGDKSHPTDRGIFHIFRKERIYRSKAYNAQMDYAMFFTQDGKAIHQYHGPVPISVLRLTRNNITDWVGSHGCVRLAEDDAKTLFDWTPSSTRVVVG